MMFGFYSFMMDILLLSSNILQNNDELIDVSTHAESLILATLKPIWSDVSLLHNLQYGTCSNIIISFSTIKYVFCLFEKSKKTSHVPHFYEIIFTMLHAHMQTHTQTYTLTQSAHQQRMFSLWSSLIKWLINDEEERERGGKKPHSSQQPQKL